MKLTHIASGSRLLGHFDLNLSLAFARHEARLVVCSGAVDYSTVVECEFGPVPRTHNGAVSERALGQGTSEMATCVDERTDPSVLTHQQRVCATGACANHAVIRQVGAGENRRELLKEFCVRVGDADALAIYEIAPEIGRTNRDRVPGPGTFPAAVIRVVSP